ncbi:Vacuolar protein sorting-associated protein 37A [Geodia barretti]|uniref:Vacuolar protein sorting-associated protein 37A n=1 Tax=Geodia barretti TaxID=519541 RepID=A0AA35SDI6_GEOBA|nr:Vacuolar protein sorting-associated protein 37A [Geodia barretti]
MASPNRRFSMQDVRLPPNLLKEIDIERMGSLSEDEGAFMEFLDSLDLEDLKKAQSKRQELSDQILQTAVINCDKEPAFEEKKTRLRLKVLELNDLKNDHSKRFEELKTLTSKGDYNSVLKELQKCLKQTEKQSEELADSYVSGSSDISADDFVAQYQEKRTLYWLRKVQAEKMEELLKNMRPVPAPRRSSNNRPSIPAPYVSPMPRPSTSLPVSTPHHPPYLHGPAPPPGVYSQMQNPAQSIQPYHQAQRMPIPQPGVPPHGHPFNPAAPFARYPVPLQRPVTPYGSYYANRY